MSLRSCNSEMNLSGLIGADALTRANMACNTKLQKTFVNRHVFGFIFALRCHGYPLTKTALIGFRP